MRTATTRALRVTRLVGWARIGFGSVLFARPRLFLAAVGFHAGSAPAQEWLVRMMAAREAGLGIGTLGALGRGDSAQPWLWAQALSDAGDTAAFLSLIRRPVGGARARGLAAFAVTGALADLATAEVLRRAGGSD